VLAVDHARDRHAEGNGCLGVTELGHHLSTERLVYVSPHVDDGLLLLGTLAKPRRSLCPGPKPREPQHGIVAVLI
jgi:hypothetical protein